jgi:hypothetical protein
MIMGAGIAIFAVGVLLALAVAAVLPIVGTRGGRVRPRDGGE